MRPIEAHGEDRIMWPMGAAVKQSGARTSDPVLHSAHLGCAALLFVEHVCIVRMFSGVLCSVGGTLSAPRSKRACHFQDKRSSSKRRAFDKSTFSHHTHTRGSTIIIYWGSRALVSRSNLQSLRAIQHNMASFSTPTKA